MAKQTPEQQKINELENTVKELAVRFTELAAHLKEVESFISGIWQHKATGVLALHPDNIDTPKYLETQKRIAERVELLGSLIVKS